MNQTNDPSARSGEPNRPTVKFTRLCDWDYFSKLTTTPSVMMNRHAVNIHVKATLLRFPVRPLEIAEIDEDVKTLLVPTPASSWKDAEHYLDI